MINLFFFIVILNVYIWFLAFQIRESEILMFVSIASFITLLFIYNLFLTFLLFILHIIN